MPENADSNRELPPKEIDLLLAKLSQGPEIKGSANHFADAVRMGRISLNDANKFYDMLSVEMVRLEKSDSPELESKWQVLQAEFERMAIFLDGVNVGLSEAVRRIQEKKE